MPDPTAATASPQPPRREPRARAAAWFAQRLDPTSAALNRCRAYRLRGPLDVAALAAAWREVTTRHPVLRGALPESPDTGLPTATPVEPPELSYVDGTGLDDGAVRAWLRGLASKPFTLATEAPARLGLARLGPARHELVLVLHGVVADEDCPAVVLAELSSSYAAVLADAPPARGADRFQRLDLAEGYDERVLWWADRLDPAPPALDLPLDRPRPAGPSSAAGRVGFQWAGGLGAAVAAHAEEHGATAEVVLLAAYLAVLRRHSGAERVPVATPVSARTDARTRTLVGPLSSLRVRVGDFTGPITWRDLVAELAAADATERARADVDLADVLRVVDVPRDPRRTPLADAVLSVRAPERGPRLRAVSAAPIAVDSGAVAADLHLTVVPGGRSLRGALRYRADVLDEATAATLLAQVRTALTRGIADPDTPVDALLLEDPATAYARAGSPAPVPAAATAPELVRAHAAARPAHAAVIDTTDGSTVDYRALHARSAGVAAALRAAGVAAGDPVVVRVGDRALSYSALLGAQWAGAHVLWLGAGPLSERDRSVIAELRPTAVLTDTDPVEGVGGVEGVQGALDVRAVPPAEATPAALDPAARAYVAYTSGSTGMPKGIGHTHAALAQLAEWMVGAFDIGPGARVAQWVTPEHDPAIAEVYATLVGGGTLLPVPAKVRAHPERLVAWLAEHRVTHLQTVAGFAAEVVRALRAATTSGAATPAHLRHLLLMGESLSADVVADLRAELPALRVYNLYGPTETIVATWHEATGAERGAVPIGGPVPGRQVLVVDADDRPCPTGVTGEIVVRTDYVTPGYTGAAGDPAVFRPLAGHPGGGCYRTGDLGRRRPDGALEFRGRRDFQVKLYGNRVELTEIEAALATHPGIAECAVTAQTNARGHAVRLVVHVLPAPGTDPDTSGWRAHLRARFGAVPLPAVFAVRAQRLPRGRTGKVDRAALPAPRAGGPGSAEPTGTEAVVSELWAHVLDGPDEFGPDDDFFAVGGHSLLLPALARALLARLGARVALWDLLAAPTVAGMAELVDRSRETGTGPHRAPDAHRKSN